MFKSHFGETVIIVLSLVMGFIMAVAVVLVDHLPFNVSKIFQIWAMITLVILLASVIIPYKEWSGKLTGMLIRDEESITYKLVDNILPSLILNTLNTGIVSAANIFYNEAIPAGMQMERWLHGFLHVWPVTFVISYLAAFAAEAAGKWVAKKYCRE